MPEKPKLKLDWATHKAAKYACEHWHYSGCIPCSMQKTYKIGVWENDLFCGVIIFGHGANPNIGTAYNLSIYEVCELTRVALKKGHIFKTSKIVSKAIKLFLIRSFPKMKLIVSYADTGQNHHGGIYQAMNWVYVGKSKGVSRIFYKGKYWHSKALKTSYPNLKQSNLPKDMPTDKHKYLYPLNKEMKNKISKLAKPYPKRNKHSVDAPADQAGEGG